MAAPDAPVVVDTNILFSALLRSETAFSTILLKADHPFLVSESILVELFRHKEKLVSLARMPEENVVQLYHVLLRHVRVEREDLIPSHFRQQAAELCREVDPADAPQVALTLAVDGLLWTGDRRLRRGLEARGFHRFFEPDPQISDSSR
jgi:predicted nucleic acid-binding protein